MRSVESVGGTCAKAISARVIPGMNVLTIKAVHRKRIAIDQYAGPVTTVILSCTGDDRNHTLRLVLRDDLRTFMEVGGDELRIDDLSDAEPAALKLGGRYRLDWKIDEDSWRHSVWKISIC